MVVDVGCGVTAGATADVPDVVLPIVRTGGPEIGCVGAVVAMIVGSG
jgi:hypothetical protein